MPWKKWIIQFSIMSVTLILVFSGVQLAKGHGPDESLLFAAFWGPCTATVFLLTRIYYFRRNIRCVVCNDLPNGGRPD
ncbi:hypothetical protein [Microbulbifer yueqingensis]|uniref:Uncharacterized protein n=1 Tax=Microbulbifer yueqingensis TaxID=658219 RepID=A0A1G9D2C8_9GAMM|nr:hypothetical protein [Microbulbifer yueqingensis]SDK58096.1 hypothetical protein SAMN05216212_2716 [Microbulbifer yueqingensis]